ncbi:MAG TPA: cupin domain-containing protein [Opitutaceae bacterium]|jgi:uncharacterized protein YjlB|nr:cupin domain-containing protein [Opitutaceae bacterium]
MLPPSGGIPNNPRLPVRIHRAAVPTAGDPAGALEALFARNGWPAQWRNGIYPFHHYHSTAHEVLGVAAGQVDVMLGGEGGRRVRLAAGDVAVLPAGTGHCRLAASPGLLVVGGYPQGQDWDTCRAPADNDTIARIRQVPDPDADPVLGRP